MRGLCALCLFCITAAGCGAADEVAADCYSVGRYKKMSQPAFDLYMMNVRSENGSRIDLYVQMQYDRLRFVKGPAGYDASYSVLFVFRGDDGESVQSREDSRRVNVATYEATQSQNTDAFLQSVTLPPGRYLLESSAVDDHSLVRYVQKTEVSAMAFPADSAGASSMLLLLNPRAGEKQTVLHPLFPQTIWHARDSMGVFQEVYGVRPGDTVAVSMTYLVLPAGAARASRSGKTMAPPYSGFFSSGAGSIDSEAYSARTAFVPRRAGTIRLIRFYPVPPPGYSELVRTVTIGREGRVDRFISRLFLFRAASMAASVGDIVDAMRYITRGDEFDSLRTSSGAVREGVIERFWAERGGPSRRADFERRVDEANKLFSVCTEGSRTPMGIMYIVCGPPEAVECRSPYTETWQYSAGLQVMYVPFRLERRYGEGCFYELPYNSVDEQLWLAFVGRWRRP